MTQQKTDRLVEDYLGAVSYACADLPPERRDDLVADLREHIAAARAVLYEPTEAAIRTILDRLGEPTAIAEEARHGEPFGQQVPAAQQVPAGQHTPAVQSASVPARSSAATLGMVLGFVLIIIAVLVIGTVVTMMYR